MNSDWGCPTQRPRDSRRFTGFSEERPDRHQVPLVEPAPSPLEPYPPEGRCGLNDALTSSLVEKRRMRHGCPRAWQAPVEFSLPKKTFIRWDSPGQRSFRRMFPDLRRNHSASSIHSAARNTRCPNSALPKKRIARTPGVPSFPKDATPLRPEGRDE